MMARRSSSDPGQGLDELDRGIVRILQKNGRTTNTEMARELEVTETTIRNRVARLLAEDLIEIVAVPTPRAVGLTLSAIIGISVRIGELSHVSDQLVECRETRYVGLSTGRYDIIVEAFFDDQEHLLDFVTQRIGSFSGVTDVETSLILKVPKFSYEWEIPAAPG
jgi:Lrp/AsnC family transcriptional regulator for asnA, asnC and gidA